MNNPKSNPQNPKRPQIILPANLEPVYANLARIAHTPSEVMLDFARMMPGDRGARVVARVLVSPLSAKLLVKALSENLAKFEAQFGVIEIPQQQHLADFLFRPPNKDDDEDEDE